jgi:hypothetical protein
MGRWCQHFKVHSFTLAVKTPTGVLPQDPYTLPSPFFLLNVKLAESWSWNLRCPSNCEEASQKKGH